MNQKYSEEFKAGAVKQVVERGYAVKEVSERLGVSIKSLYAWLLDARRQESGQEDRSFDEMRRENVRLKSELKRVEEERDILKKATAYFAKASG